MIPGLSGNAFGICTAAVSSGCAAAGGRSAGSKHCVRLEANFKKNTGGDNPVWLKTEPVSDIPSLGIDLPGDLLG